MLKFGKKVNYRPLLFSLFVSLLIGLVFGLNISKSLGTEIGIIMFSLMIIGHYLFVMPIIFNYWDSDKLNIHYSDIQKYHLRLLTIFLPKLVPIRVIDKQQITKITLIGLPQKNPNLSSELIMTEEGGFMYNILLMINEPVKIRITLRDHTIIDLDLSRDYVDRPHETIGKLKLFLRDFDYGIVQLSTDTKQALKNY